MARVDLVNGSHNVLLSKGDLHDEKIISTIIRLLSIVIIPTFATEAVSTEDLNAKIVNIYFHDRGSFAMSSDTLSLRNQKIDMVKTAAILNVVLCHVAAAPLSGGTIGTTSWYSAPLWASLAHACVPLFFIASGALLLKPEKELTLKKLYTKNFLRILATLFFGHFAINSFL